MAASQGCRKVCPKTSHGAIELLCASQALDLLAPLKTSPLLESIKAKIRRRVPFIKTDRPLTPEIEKIKDLIDKEAPF